MVKQTPTGFVERCNNKIETDSQQLLLQRMRPINGYDQIVCGRDTRLGQALSSCSVDVAHLWNKIMNMIVERKKIELIT